MDRKKRMIGRQIDRKKEKNDRQKKRTTDREKE